MAIPLFSHSGTARRVVLPATLESIQIKDFIVAEFPPSICGYALMPTPWISHYERTWAHEITRWDDIFIQQLNCRLFPYWIQVFIFKIHLTCPQSVLQQLWLYKKSVSGYQLCQQHHRCKFGRYALYDRTDPGIRKHQYVDIEAANNGFNVWKLICADGSFCSVYYGLIGPSNRITVKQKWDHTILNYQ